MINHKTYYECLEIAETASAKEIKQAYRKLIKKWHPDLHPGDEYANNVVNEAGDSWNITSSESEGAQEVDIMEGYDSLDFIDSWFESFLVPRLDERLP